MLQDRYTKVVLTVLAVGVWALALAQAGTPAVLAEAADGAAAAAIAETTSGAVAAEAESSGAPFTSYPLRWYIPLVLHVVESNSLECETTVGVVNPNSFSVSVLIQFYAAGGSLLRTESSAVAAGALYQVSTSEMAPQYPATGTVTVDGHARIQADHPNILPINYIDCVGGDISTMPLAVGATLDLFKVGIPEPGATPHLGMDDR
jgi:hypothetical protein